MNLIGLPGPSKDVAAAKPHHLPQILVRPLPDRRSSGRCVGQRDTLRNWTQHDLALLLEQLEDKRVSARQRKLIGEHRDQLLLSRELVTIDEAAPLRFDWDSLNPLEPFTEKFRSLCRELDFSSILHRFGPAAPAVSETSETSRDYLTISSLGELDEFLEGLDADVAWAIRTFCQQHS